MEFGRKVMQKIRTGNAGQGEQSSDWRDDDPVEPAWDFLDDQFALEEFENQNHPSPSHAAKTTKWWKSFDSGNEDPSTSATEEEKSFFRDLWRKYKGAKNEEQHHHHERRSSKTIKASLRRSTSSDSDDQIVDRALELNQSGSWRDDADRMKGKLKAAWNNVRYGWTIKRRPSFDEESPIWLLGKLYDSRLGLLWDLHMTFRSGFENLAGSQVYSDTGWGCMLRTGQMLLAQALILHLLGRDWTVFDLQTYDTLRVHRDIIRYFGDSPSCPLSLHAMVTFGQNDHGKTLGDWYGPGSTALVLREVLGSYDAQTDPILSQLKIYVARDNTVCIEDIEILCVGEEEKGFDSLVKVEKMSLTKSSTENESSAGDFINDVSCTVEERTWRKSLVLLIPLRLGTEHLNPVYVQHLKIVLAMRSCLGIIGGRPKHSMYFVGWHSHYWIYLDPHFCQDFIDTNQLDFPTKTYHCRWPRKLDIEDMDPSCAVGFYCRNREDLERLMGELTPVIENSESPLPFAVQGAGSQVRFPLFSVVRSRSSLIQDVNRNREKIGQTEQRWQADMAHSHGFELL